MLKLWKIPWQCPFKVITYYGKSAFTSINSFLYNSLPSDIWFLPNESVFKKKVIKLKQWQWLSNSWLRSVLAINKSTSQYPATSHLPLIIYFISFSVSCISSEAITHSAFTLLQKTSNSSLYFSVSGIIFTALLNAHEINTSRTVVESTALNKSSSTASQRAIKFLVLNMFIYISSSRMEFNLLWRSLALQKLQKTFTATLCIPGRRCQVQGPWQLSLLPLHEQTIWASKSPAGRQKHST